MYEFDGGGRENNRKIIKKTNNMKCIYCNSELPSNANFCHKCRQQVRCMICKAILVKDALICIECGKTNNQSNNNGAVNNIEISEDVNGRKLTASFTDNVAESVAKIFVNDFNFKKQPSVKGLSMPNTIQNNEIEDIELTEETETKNANPTKSDDLATLEKIFKDKNEELSMYDTRIKAKSKSDFVSRISLLYLYYKELKGEQEISRTDLNKFLQQSKLDEQMFRIWLSKSKNLVDNKKTYLCLRPEGQEIAQQFLTEFLDSSIPNVWDFKSSGTAKNKKEETKSLTNGKSKTKTNSTTYQIISSLNLKPKGKKALTDFYSEYSAKNNFENNLLFVYYMEKILEEQHIGINHINTCYKEVKKKGPNIYQSLADTKKHKGWIETRNMNNLKITTQGDNYVEHDMAQSK